MPGDVQMVDEYMECARHVMLKATDSFPNYIKTVNESRRIMTLVRIKVRSSDLEFFSNFSRDSLLRVSISDS